MPFTLSLLEAGTHQKNVFNLWHYPRALKIGVFQIWNWLQGKSLIWTSCIESGPVEWQKSARKYSKMIEKEQLLPTSVHKWKAYHLRAHVCTHFEKLDHIHLHHGHIFTSWKRGHVVDMDWPEVQLPNKQFRSHDSFYKSQIFLETNSESSSFQMIWHV